ncbi:NTPase [Candidatus Bathyarchaeota archaeon]|nr:NTPase [Candidatus Bathyarchaeota archaeon]
MEMDRRHIFLTGPPRIGKTTVVLKIVEDLKRRGVKVGGMISQEILEEGVRVGFKILDLESGAEGILAHIRQKNGPQVGKYRVHLGDLERVGVGAIVRACKISDLVVVDEVGPMELYSKAFKEAVLMALDGNKPLLGTIHYRAENSFVERIRKRGDIEIIVVTHNNRDALPRLISERILRRIGV